jgi:hypothetical protein
MRSNKQLYTYALNTPAANHHQQVFKYTKQNTFLNIVDESKLIASLGNKPDTETWTILYEDDVKPDPTSGEDPWSGLHISRPFHIMNAMSGRYLDLLNSNRPAIKTPNGRSSQNWYFDYKSKTIRNKANDQSLDMRNGANVYTYGTNSQHYQFWTYSNNTHSIKNVRGKVLDVKDSKDEEG